MQDGRTWTAFSCHKPTTVKQCSCSFIGCHGTDLQYGLQAATTCALCRLAAGTKGHTVSKTCRPTNLMLGAQAHFGLSNSVKTASDESCNMSA